MVELMSIRRVVPDITTPRLVTLVSPVNPTAQVILMTRDASAPVQPQMSIEVADVDAVHQEAVKQRRRHHLPAYG